MNMQERVAKWLENTEANLRDSICLRLYESDLPEMISDEIGEAFDGLRGELLALLDGEPVARVYANRADNGVPMLEWLPFVALPTKGDLIYLAPQPSREREPYFYPGNPDGHPEEGLVDNGVEPWFWMKPEDYERVTADHIGIVVLFGSEAIKHESDTGQLVPLYLTPRSTGEPVARLQSVSPDPRFINVEWIGEIPEIGTEFYLAPQPSREREALEEWMVGQLDMSAAILEDRGCDSDANRTRFIATVIRAILSESEVGDE